MSDSHTPGPWKAWAADDGGFEIYGSGEPDYMVLCSRNPNKDRAAEMISNARLIAAAPELLAELQHLVRLLEPAESSGLNVPGLATINGARAAIAKAEGK